MSMIELTEEQRQAIRSEQGKPVDVVDPATQQHYVLLAREQYERVRPLLDQESGPVLADPAAGVTPAMLQSQQAFWRDLPELLRDRRFRGRWVAYYRDERIGIAGSDEPLIRECVRRGLRAIDYHLDMIEPHALPPWEPEEIEPGGHEAGETEIHPGPGAAGPSA